ncbi:hypothetical protein [Chromobacterium violaceum]|uniref:Uncharacterized protein n=1 Tax=Chromobacterium violaceum TaxID=536 RepID=A0AAX2MFS0_CHRVL|nr:hypothetical protein [Chromobacterium violaceum]OLZ81246.1 hypothetical protein BS642_08930 [Chromobacterium violaceum]STB69186.1 Uncharacterised protein [Chromobacterium violaceum]SUY93551.1 Uncharacterised protein [Chromobacterium violaceum]
MKTTEARIQTLEAQVNAMARAWLYLASAVEKDVGVSLEQMEQRLQETRWPRHPDIDQEARATLSWLCGQLSDARKVRYVHGHS